jgi:integrase
LAIKKIDWHMFRAFNNTTLSEEGFSIKVPQERMGHASATVNSEHYTDVRTSFRNKLRKPSTTSRKARGRTSGWLTLAHGRN